MAQKIRIGHNKQLFIGSNAAKIDGQEIFQCSDLKMWKNQNGQFISRLKNKDFAEVAVILGARIWFLINKKPSISLGFFYVLIF